MTAKLIGRLRRAALISVLVGSPAAVAFTLHAGRRNNSRLLMAIFTLWVLSPFVLLLVACVVSKRWSVLTQATLYTAMPALTLVTLALYGYVAFGPPRAQTAAAFVVVPPVSWLLIAIAVPIAALISRRLSRQGA